MPGTGCRSDADGCAGPGERQLAVLGVDAHDVAVHEVAFEQPERERVLEQPLNRPLERTRAVGRVPAGLGERRLRRVGQLEAETALGEPAAQPLELQPDDLAELLARQRPELDDLVDPVQELRPEVTRASPRRCGCSTS